jgi:hypothetical protein
MSGQKKTRKTYEIFARINRGDDLKHIGTVEAESDDLAKVYAAFTYDEENWVEMCIVERDQLKWICRPKGLLEKEGA